VKTLICGGGTGGHIYPALAVIAEIKRDKAKKNEFLWIGTNGEIEEKLVPREGVRLVTIDGGGLVGVPWLKRIGNITKLTWSMKKVNQILAEFKPDVLFMTGGYVNLPVAVVARSRKIPALIYLPDIEPAQSVKTLSRLVDVVACTTKESDRYLQAEKCVVTGYPVRPEIKNAVNMGHEDAVATFDLEKDRQTLFVFGGSRGARSINRALIHALPSLLEKIQIIHVSGTLDWSEIETHYYEMSSELKKNYRPFPYLHTKMGAAFRAADLVLARAGASMLGECPAFAVPAILVPYPHAWRIQKVNADYLVKRGAAITITDEKLSEQLLPEVMKLMNDNDRLKKMSSAAKALDKPDSTSQLAKILLDLGEGKIS
jgi:UDP-N-acetylglucosamine--N-acetylmuramyl-(pentapeptide) pyrophosphoryl-undecaprenol N-acetylglucosamine transferase